MNYWRRQVLQLHQLMNQLRLPRYRAVIYLLNIAASPRSMVRITEETEREFSARPLCLPGMERDR